MITINNKLANINNRGSWVQYAPNTVRASNLKGWFKLETLADVVLNFQGQVGNVTTVSGSNIVSASGTPFTQDEVGKRIYINGEEKWILSVLSGTSFTTDSNFSNSNTSVTYSFGYVSKWKNSASGMLDFEQPISTSQPLIKLINNKIVVNFNSSGDLDVLASTGAYNLGTTQSYLFKGYNSKLSGNSDIFNSNMPSEWPRIFHDNLANAIYCYNLADSYSDFWFSTAYSPENLVFCAINKGNGWDIINQNNINSTVNMNVGSPIANKIINDIYGLGNSLVPGSTYSFKGNFSEFIVYDVVLTSAEIGRLSHYLNSKKY